MVSVKLSSNRKPFNWYVWNKGNKTKFHSRKIAIAYMQEIDGMLVNSSIRVNPGVIIHSIKN